MLLSSSDLAVCCLQFIATCTNSLNYGFPFIIHPSTGRHLANSAKRISSRRGSQKELKELSCGSYNLIFCLAPIPQKCSISWTLAIRWDVPRTRLRKGWRFPMAMLDRVKACRGNCYLLHLPANGRERIQPYQESVIHQHWPRCPLISISLIVPDGRAWTCKV